MSEAWNGITIAEVRASRLHRLSGVVKTVMKLIDNSIGEEYEFATGANGAVVVTNNYLTWEFIAPNNYTVPSGNTVNDLFTNLYNTVQTIPVSAWEDFAVFLNGKSSTINMFLTDGGSATITDARGNTYAGTQHKINGFSSFADCVAWMHNWFGADALAASGSLMFDSANVMEFSLTASGTTIQCSFEF